MIIDNYNKNKQLYGIIALLLAGFFVTGSILLIRYLMGKQKNKGIQPSTISFLKQVEGVEDAAYKDTAGNDTIGVGHLILPSEQDLLTKKLSEIEIEKLLRNDLVRAEAEILKNIKDPDVFNQNEFDALVSLFFNIGEGAFENSTLFKELNKNPRDEERIKTEWLKWKYSGGKPNLLSRREKEVQLFFK